MDMMQCSDPASKTRYTTILLSFGGSFPEVWMASRLFWFSLFPLSMADGLAFLDGARVSFSLPLSLSYFRNEMMNILAFLDFLSHFAQVTILLTASLNSDDLC